MNFKYRSDPFENLMVLFIILVILGDASLATYILTFIEREGE